MTGKVVARATVARRIGEKNPDGAAQAAVQSIALGLAAAVPIGRVGAILAPRLAQFQPETGNSDGTAT